MTSTAPTTAPGVSRLTALWTLAGLVLLTVNLRAAITGVAPVLGDLQDSLKLSGVEVSMLTTLPVLCLGVFASIAPVLARRIGAEAAIAVALVLITAGIVLRVVPAQVTLFGGTVLAGAGIAMGNVLMPAVIKRAFPRKVGSLTGLAMMLMAGSGAIAAGLAVPLDDTGGWRLALAVWAVPSLIAALVWSPLALRARRERHLSADTGERTPATRPAAEGTLLRSPLAWYVAGFMGLASLMFYVLMSWLPQIMRDHGFAAGEAGVMVSMMMLIGIPLGFATPVAAARMRHQSALVIGMAAVMVLGIGGLIVAPSAGWLWVVFLGLGTGSAFPLAFTLLNLRSPSPMIAARLSGMAQTAGYLLAGAGPLAVGLLHDLTGGWTISLGLLFVLIVPEVILGVLASRPGYVRPSTTPESELEQLIESESLIPLQEPAPTR
ncbi:CynX/NimT family MFS transporter [Actinomadura rupiterrae]|uniref:CynX/NimT family MFS transporter n=1 Tax=Actinomadura rupiterrae TaxID=559627 RepID=UPI0020A53008|nr:MFS transporter [Actinomadura rupiterrae]MCP2340483.1 CP family cyanate transporter-like MFS transporter [Actinomadura rupiterrae]